MTLHTLFNFVWNYDLTAVLFLAKWGLIIYMVCAGAYSIWETVQEMKAKRGNAS